MSPIMPRFLKNHRFHFVTPVKGDRMTPRNSKNLTTCQFLIFFVPTLIFLTLVFHANAYCAGINPIDCIDPTKDKCTDCDGFKIYSPEWTGCGHPCEEVRIPFSYGDSAAEFNGVTAYKNSRGWDCTSYQCTEYVKRFYGSRYGLDTCSWLRHAKDYFECADARGVIVKCCVWH